MKNELLEEKMRLVESARTSYNGRANYQTREKENFRSLINKNMENKDFFV